MKMPRISDKDIERLQKRIAYKFKDKKYINQALIHSSVQAGKGENYERLEFLGDRVLGLAVSQMLFEKFTDASEGELALRYNYLVRAEMLALLCDELQLHEFIQTGSEIKRITGTRMANLRADVVESIIAAIYLDGGFEPAQKFVLSQLAPRAHEFEASRRDGKTELQEWAHANKCSSPKYTIIERTGPDHEPKFVVEVLVEGFKPELGAGRSKRIAEQSAAEKILTREGVWK